VADLAIPSRLADTVVRWTGERGRAWLDDLPRLVTEVSEGWGLEVGSPFEAGGQTSWVAPVRRRADGLDAVLKLQLPDPATRAEATGLHGRGGDGAVHLFAHDAARCALLLERCRPGTDLRSLGGTDAATAFGAEIGARLHEATPRPALPTLASVLDPWADELEAQLTCPYVDRGLERLALATMRIRPRAVSRQVVLHGDLNPTNVLSAERERWLAIDPQPMVGDPAYDGPRLVTQPDPALSPDPAATLTRRLDIVRDVMGVEREGLVLWCLVGAVEMGASSRSHQQRAAAAAFAALVGLLAVELP